MTAKHLAKTVPTAKWVATPTAQSTPSGKPKRCKNPKGNFTK